MGTIESVTIHGLEHRKTKSIKQTNKQVGKWKDAELETIIHNF